MPWSTVLVLLSVAAAGGLAYWQMPSIFHGILPATKANLNDVAGNVKCGRRESSAAVLARPPSRHPLVPAPATGNS